MRGGNPVGTVTAGYVVDNWPDSPPLPGDYFLFPSGLCYQILDVYERREGVKRLRTDVVKLEYDEVEFGQPLNEDGSGAVHHLEWMPRKRRS